MPKLFLLGARLSACAELVTEGAKFIDIGTDHGYLPIWLLKSGRVKTAIAADIGTGPLQSAKNNAEKYDADLICILSDGFKNIEGDSFDTAVIAGMGGELMAKIISEAPFKIDESKTFILQPMTAAKEIREYLYNNGFIILNERTLMDSNKVYSVLSAKKSDKNEAYEDISLYMGKIKPHSDYSKEYALKTVNTLKNKIKGHLINNQEEEAKKLQKIIEKIQERYINE